ncbi:hypothetical protein H5410_059296 [Solanum commersonii]|uniref:SPX domain-containing protein n=1 Tax=Solanum commersonii TaxID=4109 RepID=A0A9J5W249_SOLCO|nr:hypothetical protein H5410_059296 [Solanum commersonii]
MKFGKSLSNQIEETLPEWRDKFLSYKDLKKKLKLIEPKRSLNSGDGDDVRASKRMKMAAGGFDKVPEKEPMTDAEVEFVNLLEDELEKFNSFFVEKEEEYIIRLKELQDRVAKAKDRNDEILKIRREIVDFHGEMVLLENYSALNYTGKSNLSLDISVAAKLEMVQEQLKIGYKSPNNNDFSAKNLKGLVKILKKYDKRTGALLRLPFIQRVLQQPFFTTDLLYKLVKECENLIDRLFPIIDTSCITAEADGNETSTSGNNKNDGLLRAPKELTEIEYIESLYMKSTISALRALKEIRSKSSTVSAFSLPPLQISGPEDTWNKIPILEQAAK